MSITDLTVEQGRRGSLARSLDYPEKSHTPPHPIPPPPQDDSSIIKRMLPPTHAAYVMSQRKHPVALIMKIRQIVSYEARNGNLSPGSHRSLEANLLELNRVYGMCERIRGSPIPPMYTRHTSRLLMFWLFTLPVSLHGSGISKITSLLTTVISTFVMCSLDEIGIQIEQPFRIIPMKPLSAAVMRDVADALVCLPPTLAAATEDCRVEWLTTDCREEGQTMRRKQQVSLTPSWLVPALRFCAFARPTTTVKQGKVFLRGIRFCWCTSPTHRRTTFFSSLSFFPELSEHGRGRFRRTRILVVALVVAVAVT